MAYRRVYSEQVKTYAKVIGIVGTPIALLIFAYLVILGDIYVTGYSGDIECAGTINDPCYAYVNFTTIKDIYIYPSSEWSTAAFYTDKPVKEIIIQRSWGKSWRTIDLNSTWTKDVKYSIKFSAGSSYQIRFIGYKNNPTDTIKWGFANIDPVWSGITANEFRIEYG